jgi:hypothetical protein
LTYFRNLEGFSLNDYKPFSDVTTGMDRLIHFLSAAVAAKQGHGKRSFFDPIPCLILPQDQRLGCHKELKCDYFPFDGGVSARHACVVTGDIDSGKAPRYIPGNVTLNWNAAGPRRDTRFRGRFHSQFTLHVKYIANGTGPQRIRLPEKSMPRKPRGARQCGLVLAACLCIRVAVVVARVDGAEPQQDADVPRSSRLDSRFKDGLIDLTVACLPGNSLTAATGVRCR